MSQIVPWIFKTALVIKDELSYYRLMQIHLKNVKIRVTTTENVVGSVMMQKSQHVRF